MGFQLSKLIGGLMMPVAVVLVLLITGCALLALSRYRRAGLVLVLAGTVALLLAATPPVAERALASLENHYPVMETTPPDTDWIVVLGGGADSDDDRQAVSRLSWSSLQRIAEGVRLARSAPEARLVTSGGSYSGSDGSGVLMGQVAEDWGIDRERIEVQSEPLHTAAEARATAALVEPDDTIVLVTSAYHMRRAVALFEGQSLAVRPAPAGHLVDPDQTRPHVGEYLPQAEYLQLSERALWEWIGLLWARLQGQTDG